ncbi:hypothetical protein [Gaoshiqia sediminis]|uniref:Uncharacterized protein n=1 Tax=Gaoshiqia sediminis TaxID=2986998 RepID=A0AA41Y6E6_9BACT|nr:hypothetical protein [Gaoshiqia sediminis]MCW0481972.1 hypothetical protein [Gaoshiqia sediminis]
MKIREILRLLAIIALVLFMLPSCVKEGPPGLDGANGKDGVDGVDGQDGQDGIVSCVACHNLTTRDAITSAWAVSKHGIGATAARSSTASCAPCHSHEGFVNFINNPGAAPVAISNPGSISCATCHTNHNSFDFENDGADYALRTNAAVKMIMYDDPTKVLDFQNSSNMCVNCHQSRPVSPALAPDADGNYSIANYRFGPHHGPQGNLLEGVGGYELAGGVQYPGTKSHPHRKSTNACVTCHMHEGDHTFKASLASCTDCHGTIDNFNVNSVQTEVHELMEELAELLVTAGALDADRNIIAGTYPIEVAGAVYNWKTIEEDRSMGVHNPAYIKALLTNSIEALQ